MKKTLATLLVVALVASLCGVMFVSAEAANLALGKEVANATVNVANANYCANLTDGVIADAISTDNGVWFGYLYNSDKPENANTGADGIAIPTIDLGAVTELGSARIHIVDQADWGICAPDSIVAQVSNDGENFTDVTTVTEFQSGVTWVEFDLSGQSAQYVRLAIDLSTTWFFLDEIEIYGAAAADEPSDPAAEEYTVTISHVNRYTWGVYNSMVITGECINCTNGEHVAYPCDWWIALKVDNVDGAYTVTQIEGNGEAKVMTASADGFILYVYSNDKASWAAAEGVEVGDVLLNCDFDWSADAASETPIGTMTFGPAVEKDDEPVAPVVKETIKIDGKLNDDGYDKAEWFADGLWQGTNETDPVIADLDVQYTVRSDDDNIYLTVKVNQGVDFAKALDPAAWSQDGATNFRLWFLGDGMETRTFYDLLWDGEAFIPHREKKATDELTFATEIGDDYINLEVAIAKSSLNITDSFKVMVTYSTPNCVRADGTTAYNAFHMTACDEMPSGWSGTADAYQSYNCADIALGTKAPATGDEGILVFAILGIVAIAGAAVTIKSKI